jgi:hypothetical protein
MHELVSRSLFEEQVKGLNGRLAASRSWVLHQIEYPLIDLTFTASETNRVPLRLQVRCQNWNEIPPSVTLLDGAAGFLPSANPPRQEILPNPSGIFHPGPHPNTGRPFVCMAGTLEYHTHPSHVTDYWEGYRTKAAFDLGGLLTQIWNGWLRGG